YADFYAVKENDTFQQYRNLYKATGIIFVVTIQGKAGKFNAIPLILNFSSGLALLTICTVFCDVLVLYLLKARNYYREYKYLQVEGKDAFQIMDDRKLKEIFNQDADYGKHGINVYGFIPGRDILAKAELGMTVLSARAIPGGKSSPGLQYPTDTTHRTYVLQ
ncbi:P2X purinoceptor 4, partial [Bulinus truncatus]